MLLGAPAAAQVTTLSQSTNGNTITSANSIACTTGTPGLPTFTTQQSGYFRSYPLSAFAQPIDVVSVRFAVESVVTTAPGGFPMLIRLYGDPNGGAPSPYASLQLRHTESFTLLPSATSTIVVQPMTGVPATFLPGETLVVEVNSPLGGVGTLFFIGSNALGQTAPGYLRSVTCGIADPTPLSAPQLSSPNMHMIIDVNVVPVGGSGTPHPGTGEDLTLSSGVNANALSTGPGNSVKTVMGGDFLTLRAISPAGTFDYREFVLIAQSFATGSTPPSGVAPHIHLSYPGLVFVIGGLASPFPSLLPPGGSTSSYLVPPGFSGASILVQGVVITSTPPFANNGLYASTDAHEIRIL